MELQVGSKEPLYQIMLARYYSSSLGRFMAVDPGDDTQLESPQSWNKYAYVRNNPVNSNDPDGKVANWIIGGGIGAAIGGAGEAARQYFAGEDLNWQNIGAAAAGGFVSGALAGGTFGASLIAETGVFGAVTVGATSNVAGGVVQRSFDSTPGGALDGESMLTDAAVGAIGGGVGHTAEVGVQSAKAAQVEALQGQVARQEGNLARPSRTAPAKRSATKKLEAAKKGIKQAEGQARNTGTVVGTTTTNAAAPIARENMERQRPR